MTTKTCRLVARTNAARKFLSKLYSQHQMWAGRWFVLDQEPKHRFDSRKPPKAKRLLVAPAGHQYDKIGRWVDVQNDTHFLVRNLT